MVTSKTIRFSPEVLEYITCRAFEPQNPLKIPNLPSFHAWVWPGMEFPVILWAEKLVFFSTSFIPDLL
jgi:hypothetical protein